MVIVDVKVLGAMMISQHPTLEHPQWYHTINYLTHGKRNEKHLNIALFAMKHLVILYFLFILSLLKLSSKTKFRY
jgi:hypothetical protein